MKIWWQLAGYGACDLYRSILPCRFLVDELAGHGVELCLRADYQTDDWKHYDVFVFHRNIRPIFWKEILRLKERGKKVWWELDDDVFNIPEWSSVNIGTEERWFLCQALIVSDKILVSTSYLRDALGADIVEPVVCPNLIDLDMWPTADERPDDGVKRIIWTGSNTHEKDCELLIEPMTQIMEKYKGKVAFIVFGYCHPEILRLWYGKGLFVVPECTTQEYAAKLVSIGADIGLCPLVDCEFNRSKSNCKWMELTMAGAAVIASDVGPYSFIDGRITVEVISQLIEHPTASKYINEAYRQTVVEEHSWQSATACKQWVEAILA